ncbi:exodeoxyribonuclease VII small subunit [Alkalilimnicola ehrlichii MLHE-1]|uniref:Exodeoxyribonuclease 7 small subunit n=1 Tax=Alkalilimnicola ehrlichii (strain ATCC BAA-1101 / DSM 17681 / MLHE-1) TaxID=187272 RepID=EX7S_ALKEH|nr:exodeoxyribonuclease VII small subunit [Alkalilimnicola ehrlichii]Q0AA37.1 RecName: Full=Exodeoxyribonuclease 7 small subunit; AltName: Full=Exodeoxyribonuclease VII small subunit; Short=Exonuclease VII small subunit [Alkalilimnicola ehrlichii MLHE-1]ABI56300.1 Exodeoxyribonuclease VII small subunit [Alkalilimnicola ehrlichii MLHE-1]
MDTPSSGSDSFDFEAALKELEGLVERMERGELSLEESLRQFERGVELTRACQKALQEAEQKVETLIGQGADAHEQAFEDPAHRDT